MDRTSRDSLAAARERFDARVAERPDAAGFGGMAETLFATVSLLRRESALRRALGDPSTRPEAKVGLLESLFAEFDEQTLEVLRGLVRARWSSPGDLVEAVETLAVSALLAVAESEDHLDDVEDELFRFTRLLEDQTALRAALTDPVLPLERKLDVLRDLLTGTAQPATERLIEQAVREPHGGQPLEQQLGHFSELAAQRRRWLLAEVRTAVPLTDDQQRRLGEILAGIYGRTIQVQSYVDPDVVGGVLVRVGDEVIDGSIVHRLAQARLGIAAGAAPQNDQSR
jgi:F-type H+-transporting ATPase subunit delta